MKVIYLASGRAKLNYPDVIYNDIKEKRDLTGDMMSIDLNNYDILIATPPATTIHEQIIVEKHQCTL